MENQTHKSIESEGVILATFNNILLQYLPNQQKKVLKYFEAMKLRKEESFGARKISKVIDTPEGAVNYWLTGGKPPAVKGLENLKKIGLLPLVISGDPLFKHFIHLLGLRYADGCIYYQKNNHSYTFYLCFGNKIDATNFVKNTRKVFGADLNTHHGSRAYYVYLPSELARLAIHISSPVGNKTERAFRLPKWIFALPPKWRWEFLSGLFSGDGSAPRLKPYGSSSESLKLSLNAKESTVETFCEGFMTDLWNLISNLGIKASKPKISWSTPIISKNNTKTYPVIIRILTQKDNMIKFLENISYTYCNKAFNKSAETLAVLKGSKQNANLNSFFLNEPSLSPKISVLLEAKTQKNLIVSSANRLSTKRGKYTRLAQYLNKVCESLKEVKCSSIRDNYLANWKFGRAFIPLGCLVELLKLNNQNLSSIQKQIVKIKDFRSQNRYAVDYVNKAEVKNDLFRHRNNGTYILHRCDNR